MPKPEYATRNIRVAGKPYSKGEAVADVTKEQRLTLWRAGRLTTEAPRPTQTQLKHTQAREKRETTEAKAKPAA